MKSLNRIEKILICAAIAATLSSCGGGGASEQPVKVSYSDKVAAGTVENYTNANWLYQNYFGDYGLPNEVKPSFMPAMQMLANGFVLQMKTGQDVKANIEQVHSMFLQYAASGQAATFLDQVKSDTAIGTLPTANKDAVMEVNSNFIEPIISDEDKLAIEAAKLRDAQEEIDIKNTVTKYELPYQIDLHKEQWFIYSPTMKGGGKGGGSSSSGGGVSQPKKHSDVYGWGWRRGDVVWVNGTGSITGVPGHNAIIWGEGREVYLNDANTDVGVSRRNDMQAWMDKYTEVRALTPKLNWSMGEFNCYTLYGGAYGCAKDSYQRQYAWTYAQNQIGKPYNWVFTNPRDTSKFYCSSLIWNAYESVGYNIIAPWGLGLYTIITPSMLKDSKALTTYKVSTI